MQDLDYTLTLASLRILLAAESPLMLTVLTQQGPTEVVYSQRLEGATYFEHC